MKIIPSRRHSESGSMLAITLIISALIGLTLAAYLDLTSFQNRSTVRSQSWNSAIPYVEAGLEEAMTQLYYNSTNLSSNGWTLTNSVYFKSRTVGEGRYQVSISNCIPPVIYSIGYVRIPLSTNELSRTVRVNTYGGALFARGILTKGSINMGNGNTDSFDSFGTNTYAGSVQKGNGDLGSTAQNVSILSNGDIFGHVAVGPNGTINNSGYIGPVAASTPAGTTTAGYTDYTLSASIPDVVAPSFAGATAVNLSSGYTFTGSIASGKYTAASLGGTITVTNGAKVVIYVSGSFSFTGHEGISISTNSSLTVYMAGSSASIGGNGIVNQGNALNCQLYGMNTCTSISIAGNGQYIGTIDAPYADLTINGGGSRGYFIGAAIVNTATFAGNGADFHYDENLKNNGPRSTYVITGWNEI